MSTSGPESRSGRETRLLLLVIGVSLAVLLLLARWRFPEAALSSVPPSAAPLAGLAARASFDEMANTMADLLGRLSPSLVVTYLAADPGSSSGRTGRARDADAQVPPERAIALRIGHDAALMHVPRGMRAVGSLDGAAPLEVLSADPTREMAVVRVPEAPGSQDLVGGGVRSFPGLSFVVVVEPSPAGPTIQPVFIGRTDSAVDARWAHPLIVVGPSPSLPPGAFVFSMAGRFIGMVVRNSDGLAIVPAPALGALFDSTATRGTTE